MMADPKLFGGRAKEKKKRNNNNNNIMYVRYFILYSYFFLISSIPETSRWYSRYGKRDFCLWQIRRPRDTFMYDIYV